MVKKLSFPIVCILALAWLQTGFAQDGADPQKVCFGEACFDVEIAKTLGDRIRGLKERESLDANSGMLFIFPEFRRQGFWMQDTLIPLDIIWMDQEKNIVAIIPGIPPCKEDPCPSYNPVEKALYVLEINAGLVEEIGLKVGDQAEFRVKGYGSWVKE